MRVTAINHTGGATGYTGFDVDNNTSQGTVTNGQTLLWQVFPSGAAGATGAKGSTGATGPAGASISSNSAYLAWVDPNGSDSTGEARDFSKPFATLAGAIAYLNTNSLNYFTIVVQPGAYQEVIGNGTGGTKLIPNYSNVSYLKIQFMSGVVYAITNTFSSASYFRCGVASTSNLSYLEVTGMGMSHGVNTNISWPGSVPQGFSASQLWFRNYGGGDNSRLFSLGTISNSNALTITGMTVVCRHTTPLNLSGRIAAITGGQSFLETVPTKVFLKDSYFAYTSATANVGVMRINGNVNVRAENCGFVTTQPGNAQGAGTIGVIDHRYGVTVGGTTGISSLSLYGCYTVSRYRVPAISVSIGSTDGSSANNRYHVQMGNCKFFCSQGYAVVNTNTAVNESHIIYDVSSPSGSGKYPIFMVGNCENSFQQPSNLTRMPRYGVANRNQLDNRQNINDPRGYL
jgi:hypothetical protein